MKISLLIIATEILEGKITDLNTRALSEFLRTQELELASSLTVRDDEAEINRALNHLLSDCDVLVTSGGLGPTKDDLTKDVLGRFLGRASGFSAEAHAISEENYKRMGRPYPGKEHLYSQLPNGFTPLSNSAGFAPGLFARQEGKSIFCAPGVPREFVAIITDHLGPWIRAQGPRSEVMENVVIRTRRVPEEKIFGEVDPLLWEKLSRIGSVSSLPILMGVDIGVKLRARTPEELRSRRQEVLEVIERSPIKSSVWHVGQEKLEEVLIQRARSKKATIAVAESCSGGLIAHRLTNVPGSSQVFFGGVVSYDTSIKERLLNVSSETIEAHGVVSVQTAEAMALGAAKALGTDLAVSTTGIAGPSGGTVENPVGTVCIGLYVKGRLSSVRYQLRGDRELLKERFAQAALMALLESADF